MASRRSRVLGMLTDAKKCMASFIYVRLDLKRFGTTPVAGSPLGKESIMAETSGSDPRVGLAQRRTELANFRTAQALDRTMLAWVRTALTMGSFGFGMIAFFRALREKNPTTEAVEQHQMAIRFGETLVLMGVVATILAAI